MMDLQEVISMSCTRPFFGGKFWCVGQFEVSNWALQDLRPRDLIKIRCLRFAIFVFSLLFFRVFSLFPLFHSL